jgi:hypothetical protein
MGQVQMLRRPLRSVVRTTSTERTFERLRRDGPAARSPRKSTSFLLVGRRRRGVERPQRDVIATTPLIPRSASETGDGNQPKAGDGGRDAERLESCSVPGVPQNPMQCFENIRFRLGLGRAFRGRNRPIPGAASDRSCQGEKA